MRNLKLLARLFLPQTKFNFIDGGCDCGDCDCGDCGCCECGDCGCSDCGCCNEGCCHSDGCCNGEGDGCCGSDNHTQLTSGPETPNTTTSKASLLGDALDCCDCCDDGGCCGNTRNKNNLQGGGGGSCCSSPGKTGKRKNRYDNVSDDDLSNINRRR